jgi:hypothetical protein
MNWVNELATATIGLPKSLSFHSGGTPQAGGVCERLTGMSGIIVPIN